MVGEYGGRNTTDAKSTYLLFMQGSCIEAVYMIGMERNSDVVKMAAYVCAHVGAPWICFMVGR